MSSSRPFWVFTDPDPDKWWEIRTTHSYEFAKKIQEKFPHLICTQTEYEEKGDSLLTPSFSKIEE